MSMTSSVPGVNLSESSSDEGSKAPADDFEIGDDILAQIDLDGQLAASVNAYKMSKRTSKNTRGRGRLKRTLNNKTVESSVANKSAKPEKSKTKTSK